MEAVYVILKESYFPCTYVRVTYLCYYVQAKYPVIELKV